MDKIKDCYLKLMDEIDVKSKSNETSKEEEFFNIFSSILEENGDTSSINYSPYISKNLNNDVKSKKIRVDGYSYEVDNDITHNTITLIISDFNHDNELSTFNTNQLEQEFKLAEQFIQICSEGMHFINSIDESSSGFDIAYTLSSTFSRLNQINIFLITNTKFTGRIKEIKSKKLYDKRITYKLMDIERYALIVNSQSSEPTEINVNDYGLEYIQTLKTSSNDHYSSYLIALSGELLFKIYEDYQTRLLEQNVRVFLQARGGVNKGIINTIKNTPELFFAYNNGITATASFVETVNNDDSKIVKFNNLQIVNGGQTTACIYYAKIKDKADLTNVYVQMKLSVINEDKISWFVPKISEFANTQNKVNAADFFANHPFFLNFQTLSENAVYPKKEGALNSEKWFYEKARGAYNIKTLMKSPAEKKAFEKEYPKNLLIKKEFLAKFMMSYELMPSKVARGAQQAFKQFASMIGNPEKFSKNIDFYNKIWFRHVIAKAIIFNALEKLILKETWYEGGGSRATIMPYILSWLVKHLKEKHNSEINYDLVWNKQEITDDLISLFKVISYDIFNEMKNTLPASQKNFQEWGKKDECWDKIKDLNITLDEELVKKILIKTDTVKEIKKEAGKEQKKYNAQLDYMRICMITPELWKKIAEFIIKNSIKITPMENESLVKRISSSRNLPSQAEVPKYIFPILTRVYENDFSSTDNGLDDIMSTQRRK